MAHVDTTIIQVSDRVIVELFSELSRVTGNKFSVNVSGLTGDFAIENELIARVFDENISLINRISLSGANYSVYYNANRLSDGRNESYHPYYSNIRLNISDNPRPNDQEVLEVRLKINRFILANNLLPSKFAVARDDGTDTQAAVLSALQASAADQISRVNKFFAELTEKFDARRRELEASYEDRVAKLEDQFAAKEQALTVEQEALDTRRKELDDRDNTHARRAIRGELIRTIQERQKSFTISPETTKLRWPIHAVFVSLLSVSLAGTLWSLYVWGTNPTDAWGAMALTSAVKTAVFTFGFLTSAGLYISWMNRWFDKHADAQFHTKQFEIDINRATWAVEAALEWKNVEHEQMPDALLVGITKHLFEHTAGETPEYSPLEALASSILGSASNLKMNLNGSEVSLDRRSIRQLKATESS